MRYVIEVEYDDTHQECTNEKCPAKWHGGPYDEPFKVCPICCHGLTVVEPRAPGRRAGR